MYKIQECSICMEALVSGHEICVRNGKHFTCGHVFHGNCLKAWIASVPSCPVCRCRCSSTVPLRFSIEVLNQQNCSSVKCKQLEDRLVETEQLLESALSENRSMDGIISTLQEQLAKSESLRDQAETAAKRKGEEFILLSKELSKSNTKCNEMKSKYEGALQRLAITKYFDAPANEAFDEIRKHYDKAAYREKQAILQAFHTRLQEQIRKEQTDTISINELKAQLSIAVDKLEVTNMELERVKRGRKENDDGDQSTSANRNIADRKRKRPPLFCALF